MTDRDAARGPSSMAAAKRVVVPRPTTTLPSRSIDDLFEELSRLRELVERLVQPEAQRQWLTVDEAALLVHRTPQAVRYRCRSHRIGIKIGRSWRIDRAQLFSHF